MRRHPLLTQLLLFASSTTCASFAPRSSSSSFATTTRSISSSSSSAAALAFSSSRSFLSTSSYRAFTTTTTAIMSATANSNANAKKTGNQKKKKQQQPAQTTTPTIKPRILCLHGRYQSGAIFANKIAGARRKLERKYELDFLDGPIRLPNIVQNNTNTNITSSSRNTDGNGDETTPEVPEEIPYFAWWDKDETTGKYNTQEGLDYVLQHIQANTSMTNDQKQPYAAVIGFSQGGVVATALCCSGLVPSLKAVVTAGSPMVEDAFVVADAMATTSNSEVGFQCNVPKLHMAGETDAMVPVSSTTTLCDRGGNGTLILHDQGHLFPTRSVRVQAVLDFLEESLELESIA